MAARAKIAPHSSASASLSKQLRSLKRHSPFRCGSGRTSSTTLFWPRTSAPARRRRGAVPPARAEDSSWSSLPPVVVHTGVDQSSVSALRRRAPSSSPAVLLESLRQTRGRVGEGGRSGRHRTLATTTTIREQACRRPASGACPEPLGTGRTRTRAGGDVPGRTVWEPGRDSRCSPA